MSWRVAGASQYLVITGVGINDVKLAKKAWVFPGQKSTIFDITPVNYEFDVQAMSAEKLLFVLPAVFTIGPKLEPGLEALEKYAKLVAPLHKNQVGHVKEIVRGIIEGETRVLAAGMTMEEIFKGTKEFKQEVFDKVQLELNAFGLHIYNANVKQLVDVPGHEYFSYLGQKIQQEAANSAKVAVAEAKFKGNVGAKEREGLTKQNAAKVDAETKIFATRQEATAKQQELKAQAETKVYENTRKAEVAQADSELAKKSAQWTQEAEVAKIQAAKAAAIKEAELQREVELRRAQAETERLRASQLAPAVIKYETTVQEAKAALFERQRAADAELFEKQRAADAVTYESERAAEARRQAADAAAYAAIKDADARLYAAKKEAEGIVAIAEAKAEFLRKVLAQLDGSYSSLHDFLLLDRGIYQDMGRINADAIRGLNPKISIWTTEGNGAPNGAAAFSGSHGGALTEVSNIYKAIPPLLTTIKDQTGVTPLPLLATLPRS